MTAKITRRADRPGKFVIVEDGTVVASHDDFDTLADHLKEAAKRGVTVDEYLYWKDCEAEAEAERYAEFGMSWVAGGGMASDVAAAYRQHVLGEEPARGDWPVYGGPDWDEGELIAWEREQYN